MGEQQGGAGGIADAFRTFWSYGLMEPSVDVQMTGSSSDPPSISLHEQPYPILHFETLPTKGIAKHKLKWKAVSAARSPRIPGADTAKVQIDSDGSVKSFKVLPRENKLSQYYSHDFVSERARDADGKLSRDGANWTEAMKSLPLNAWGFRNAVAKPSQLQPPTTPTNPTPFLIMNGARGSAPRFGRGRGVPRGGAVSMGMRKRTRASSAGAAKPKKKVMKAKGSKTARDTDSITPQSAARYWDARLHKGVSPALPGSLGKFHVVDALFRWTVKSGTTTATQHNHRVDHYIIFQFSPTDICALVLWDLSQTKDWAAADVTELLKSRMFSQRDTLSQLDPGQIQGIRPLRHTVTIRNVTKADDVAGDIYVMPSENEFKIELPHTDSLVPSVTMCQQLATTMNRSVDTRQLTAASLRGEGKSYNLYPATMDGFAKYYDFIPPGPDYGTGHNITACSEAYKFTGKTRAQGALVVKIPVQTTVNEYEITVHRQVGVRLDPSHAFFSSGKNGPTTSADKFTKGANLGRRLQ